MTTPDLHFWPNGIRNSLVYEDCITLQPYEFVNKKNSEGNDDKISLRVPKEKNGKIILILLPIPNSIQFNDGISWTTEDLKAVGDQLKEIVSGAQNKDSRLADIAENVAAGLGAETLLDQVAKIQFLGLTKNSISQSLGKKILNPYTEQIFQGIGLRSFSFNWKLVPRDEDEQKNIYEIIKNLRVYSTPNISGASFDEVIFGEPPSLDLVNVLTNDQKKLSDRWLTLPSSWKIEFIHVQNGQSKQMKFIPKLKYCVITDISVNYTPDGYWSTHYTSNKEPAPVAYDLSINFQETEIITSDLIKNGY